MPRRPTKCPHGNIVHCPLYIAAHYPGLGEYSCADGRLNEGGCAVKRGLNYEKALARLSEAAPKIVQPTRIH